jgi:hypothetical protein
LAKTGGKKVTIKYFIDYPQERIEEGVNNYQCSYCKVSTLEINGLLEKHKSNCKYRLEKETSQ